MGCFFSFVPPHPLPRKVPIPLLLKISSPPQVSAWSQAHTSVFLGSDSVNLQLPTTLPTTFQSRVKEKSRSLFPCLWKLAPSLLGKIFEPRRGPKRHLNEAANCSTCFCEAPATPERTCSAKILVQMFPRVEGLAGRAESSQSSGMLHNPLKSFE